MPVNSNTGFLCDVNLLVAFVIDAHEHSASATAWLDTIQRRQAIHVCRVSQLGFLRLITSPRIFADRALKPVDAWIAYDMMMRDDRFAFIEEPKALRSSFREFSDSLQKGAMIGTDVYLAAFAHAADLQIATFDSGFRRFAGLSVHQLH